eukprot:1392598-Amorphochlora_amoeboformis.AAC.2
MRARLNCSSPMLAHVHENAYEWPNALIYVQYDHMYARVSKWSYVCATGCTPLGHSYMTYTDTV